MNRRPHDPEPCILPTELRPVLMYFRLTDVKIQIYFAPVAQRIEQTRPKSKMRVQFLPGVLMSHFKIILASISIGRKQLLEKIGVDFQILPSTIDEDKIIHSNPIKMLQMRSWAKAQDVVTTIRRQTESQLDKFDQLDKLGDATDIVKSKLNPKRYLIVAADSMAILRKPFGFAQGKAYGKAKTKTEGKQILQALMGKTHEFVTAASIVHLELLKELKILKRWNSITTTRVTMRQLNPDELESYVKYFDFSKFAAGYAINEYPTDLITKIDGSYTNVIGLPFEVILPIFRKFKII